MAFSAGQGEKAGSLGLREEQSPTLRGCPSGTNMVPTVAFTVSEQANGFAWERPIYPSIMAHPQTETSHLQTGIRQGMSVRRLTPTECLRLQGFPDDWLDLNPPLSDSTKYRMVGNAVTVPVIQWLAKRFSLAYVKQQAKTGI